MSSAILKSFSWCGPAIQRLCEADAEFANYLICQPQEHRQCLVFVVLGWERLGSASVTPKELAMKVRQQSKKALLKQFYRPYPAGLVPILKKLGNRIMIKDRYIDLSDLLLEPSAAKFLWHERKIQPFMISALMGLEPVFRRPSIVRHVINQSILYSFQYAIAIARRIAPNTSDAELAKSLENTFSKLNGVRPVGYRAQCKLEKWLARRLNKTDVPAPPWVGTQKLRPILNCHDILKVADDFENCLADELARVIGKKRYFYLWKDRGSAVVALENDPLLGWIVGEIKGPHNRAVSKLVKNRIIDEFRTAGIEEYQGAQEFNLYN